jgi:predicted nucleic acid-binding protein
MSDAVIDTCCLTNVAACGELPAVLSHTGFIWHVPPAVAAETIFVRAKDSNGRIVKQQVDLEPFYQTKVLLSAALAAGEETALYVDLAADLSDGEAMALAIASCRGWKMATDDRKARRRAMELGTEIITTPQIMRLWTANAHPDEGAVRTALLNIQLLAKFIPAADFPEFNWWNECISPEL